MKRTIVLVALAAALVAGCKGGKGADATPAGRGGFRGGKGGRGGLAFAADVIPIEARKVPYVVTAPGTIDAFEHVQVTARVAGAVDRVAFAEGQEVKKGDVLVVIDSERYYLAVASAKAALAKADAAVTDAEGMVTRREGASDKNPGLIPGEELASYKTKTLTAKADRDVALQALKVAQVNLRDSSVRAPMDGVIQTRSVETGQYVQPGYVMATLLRRDPMLLRFDVEPSEAPRIKIGMVASFTMRETLRTFSAKITLVGGAADPTTHMVPVTAEVVDDGHKYWLRPGSFCDVTIEINAQREAPVIPRLATRATDHGYVAYVVDGGVAHEKPLTLGMSTKDGWVEVRSGLAAGELLVVHGAEALSEGAKVKATRISPDTIANGDPDAPESADAGASQPADAGAPAPAGAPDGGRRRRRDHAAPGASAEATP